MYSGVLFHTLYVTTTDSQLNKRECSSSFTLIFRAHSSIHRDLLLTAQQKSALNQNKIRNVIAYKNAGNCPYSQSFAAPRNRGPRLSLFSPMVNPRLPGRWILPEWQNFLLQMQLRLWVRHPRRLTQFKLSHETQLRDLLLIKMPDLSMQHCDLRLVVVEQHSFFYHTLGTQCHRGCDPSFYSKNTKRMHISIWLLERTLWKLQKF